MFKYILFITSLFMAFNSIHACKCGYYIGSVLAADVFSGKVRKIKKRFNNDLVFVEVTKHYKGKKKRVIKIKTRNYRGACGFSFVEGNVYLVYTHNNFVSACSYTENITGKLESEIKIIEGPDQDYNF